MPQYLLSVIHDWDNPPFDVSDTDAMNATFAAVDAFNNSLTEAGHWVFAGGLEPPSTATVVNATGSDTVITDGPYLEAKEHLGGFWIIEAADLDQALALAERGSRACRNAVEVRPFQSEPAAD